DRHRALRRARSPRRWGDSAVRDIILSDIRRKVGPPLDLCAAPDRSDLIGRVKEILKKLAPQSHSTVLLFDWLDCVAGPTRLLGDPELTQAVSDWLVGEPSAAALHRAMLKALVRWGAAAGPSRTLEDLFARHLQLSGPDYWCPGGPPRLNGLT